MIKNIFLRFKFLPYRIKSNFLKKKINNLNQEDFYKFKKIINNKNFSSLWFLNNFLTFNYFFPKEKKKFFSFLEIGSFEGMSALYVLSFYENSKVTCIDLWNKSHVNRENLSYDFNLIETNFDQNLKDFQFKKIKNYSLEAIKDLKKKNKYFDIIYIDGSHEGKAIYSDAVAAFYILKKDGILIFDDIDINIKEGKFTPIEAINKFLNLFNGSFKILYFKRLVFLKKII